MSDELFEVTFFGQINDDANLSQVKENIARMFNADERKLEQLFSGSRVVVKKNINRQTAEKYQSALHRAGAKCEIKSMSAVATEPPPDPLQAAHQASTPVSKTATPASGRAGQVSDDMLPPPQTDPLGIKADQIEDLQATIAPVGSELQSETRVVPEPQYDLSEFDVAPVGSQLGVAKKQPDPPPPDTTGITLADE